MSVEADSHEIRDEKLPASCSLLSFYMSFMLYVRRSFSFANAVGCHNHFRYRNICNEYIGCVYRVSQKSKLLILRKCVNEDETIGGTWTNTISCRENEALSDFSREIFYVTIVLCLNIPWLKAVSEITARQTRTSFAKFSKKLQHIIFNHTSRFSNANFHKIMEYVMLGLWNICYSATCYFFDPPCIQYGQPVGSYLLLELWYET